MDITGDDGITSIDAFDAFRISLQNGFNFYRYANFELNVGGIACNDLHDPAADSPHASRPILMTCFMGNLLSYSLRLSQYF